MRCKHFVVTLALLVLAGAACSNDESSTTSTSSTTASTLATTPEPVPLSARGTATLTGAMEASGDYEVQYPVTLESCAALATAGTYVIPLPGRLGAVTLQWQAAIPELRGAGRYDLADLATFRVTVTADDGGPATVFGADGATTAELVLADDGGGEFTFSGLGDNAGAELDGNATWECEPRA